MGKYTPRSKPSETPKHPPNIYVPGKIVYILTDAASRETQPKDCQKLWIWDYKWDPTYKNESWSGYNYGNTLYLLKDGPGKEARDVGWVHEEGIREWAPPKVEESLIDLDPEPAPPAYEEVMKKG